MDDIDVIVVDDAQNAVNVIINDGPQGPSGSPGAQGPQGADGAGGGSSIVINVKDAPFNAVGDGYADDTASVQAAIDYGVAVGGGIIFFPAGTYLITSQLVIPIP
jgi:hypothetical protein